MRIERVPMAKLKPADYNPRQHLKAGDAAYEKLVRSMEEYGYVQPLVWNKATGNLVGGHQRLKILIAQGATEVDVVVVELTPEKEKALNLALNKIQGDWDQQKLAQLLDELITLPDFDLRLTGFDLPEAQEIIDEVLRPLDEAAKGFAREQPGRTKLIDIPSPVIPMLANQLFCPSLDVPDV